MKTIEELIKKIKKSAKAFNSAEDVKGTLYETSLRKVFNATKKGNFPVTLVAIENGKVVDQKLVGTREIVPAAFNAMQEDYPKAQINVEDRTGKILFRESINEATKDLWGSNALVSINSIKKYLKAMKSGVTIHLNKKISYTKVEDDVFTSDKHIDLGLDQLANVMDQAFKKKQKVQVEESSINKSLKTKVK